MVPNSVPRLLRYYRWYGGTTTGGLKDRTVPRFPPCGSRLVLVRSIQCTESAALNANNESNLPPLITQPSQECPGFCRAPPSRAEPLEMRSLATSHCDSLADRPLTRPLSLNSAVPARGRRAKFCGARNYWIQDLPGSPMDQGSQDLQDPRISPGDLPSP
eukprot:82727-Prorocentrum_minimum.AAC.1